MGRTFYETHAFVNTFYIVVRFGIMLDDGTLALVIYQLTQLSYLLMAYALINGKDARVRDISTGSLSRWKKIWAHRPC
jgi:hypothetical protein